MAELQIDQSNLPCVQEVCQSFAVLEDGVLAHNLQEQEIEQYYCSNVQKNQLVQNDIRVAKRLQDEEERRCRALLRQESRQLEEDDDFEYARLIQEEIRRRAREVRRRERDDQEMAEQMQEEEELMMRRAREEEHHRGGSSGAFMPPLPSQHQHALSGRSPAQALYSPTTSRWHYSNTRNPPEHSRPPPPPDYPGRAFASESLHAHSDGFEQRANQRRDPAPPPPLHRRLSLRLPGERHGRGTPGSVAEEEYYGRADGEERQREVDRRVENGPPRAGQDGAAGAAEAGERRRRRSQSVRIHHRPRRGSGDSSGTHGYRDNADKRVRFATDGGSSCRGRPPDAGVPRLWEMLGHVLRERGVAVSVGGRGAPLKISPQSPAGRPLGPSHPPHGTPFLRAASARHSFHGDLRERRSSSRRDVGERERGLDGHFSHIGGGGAGNGWARHDGGRACHDGGRGLADVHEDPPERIADGRPTAAEEAFGSDEEAGGQRGAQRSFPRRTGSWLGWRRSAAEEMKARRHPQGASLPPKKKQTSLDLGDLQQVLCDEELARKLHEQENNLLARTSRRPSRGRYPEGDFRVAQVAQDEEIAHYMQKQEMESNRMSRQLEEPTSRGEHRHHRSTTPDRQVEWEGLPSPVALTSPVSTLRQSPPVQNIAEELDPTFRAKRQGADILQTEQSGGACQWLPGPRRLLEEPAFIPPTKRQKDKAKEKKEKCKQQ